MLETAKAADDADNRRKQEGRDEDHGEGEKFEDAERADGRGRAAPALGEMEFVGRKALGDVPPDHRRLDENADQRREIEMWRSPQWPQRPMGNKEHGNAEGEENTIVLGQYREPKDDGGGIQPAQARAVGLPALRKDQHQM